MLVLNLPFKALMFLTLMRPSLVLFLVLWLKLVKDFLKVRCRLALLPFLISCLIWLDLVASLPLIKERILVIILLLDDFDFLTSNKVWIATDRSRARRCVEACVYGTLDFVGYPRFPAPVEFIAAVIAYYVHPVNIQTACLIMEGAEFTENIINGVERPVKAAELFAFTLRVRAGNTDVLTDAEENVRQKLRAEGVM